ncbi:MAG: RDD family protein [Oleiharenicola lentus]
MLALAPPPTATSIVTTDLFMNTVRHPKYIVFLLLALGLVIGPVLGAQDKPEAPAAPEAAPAAPVVPDKPEAAATEQKKEEEKPVRELAADDSKPEVAAEDEKADQPEKTHVEYPDGHRHRRSHQHGNNERVSFGSDSTLAAGEVADSVVSIIGSSTSAGDVGDAVVSVIGSSRVTDGTVGDSVVSVLGNTYVNGHVKGEVVAVLGSIELGPKAVVEGQLVCIGGRVTKDASAVVKGPTHNIAIAGHYFNFEGLGVWFKECLLYARPLAFDSRLGWAWCIAFGFLAFYVLIALIAPKGVVKCVETLEQKPGYSLLSALLTLLLTPIAFVLLALTLVIAIGFVIIPAFSLGLFFAAIFGKIVMLAWLGRRFTKLLGDGPLSHPVFGVLIGGLLVLGLYTIPIVGFIVYKLLGILGLGVVVYTLLLQFKASRPPKPVKAAVVAAASAAVPGSEAVPPVAFATGVSAAPVVISAVTLPRAGFWLRLGSGLLDLIMVGMATGLTEGLFRIFHFHPGGAFPFWFVVYCVIMWATRGTTIGGIICGLKVVRLDDRPVDWGVAIVRGLSAFLSLAVAGLGFIWVAFDDEKQSWHDKIAGTTIVKVPKGTALL